MHLIEREQKQADWEADREGEAGPCRAESWMWDAIPGPGILTPVEGRPLTNEATRVPQDERIKWLLEESVF